MNERFASPVTRASVSSGFDGGQDTMPPAEAGTRRIRVVVNGTIAFE